MFRSRSINTPSLDWPDLPCPLEVRSHPRAKRLRIRFDAATGTARLTVPSGCSPRIIQHFVKAQQGWLARQLAQAGPFQDRSFTPGQIVPIREKEHLLEHIGGRGVAEWTTTSLRIPGNQDHFSRRVRDALRSRAEADFNPIMLEKTKALSRPPTRLIITDTTSRWGSCTSHGVIRLSWRLILAPEAVLDYVISHEAAHLAHLNHSPGFWRCCQHLCTGGTQQCQSARYWLRRHGHELHQWGNA